ncbi:MAG: LysR family transcriptional regulator [Acidobacteria bacterium]|nr:LysR family transcriptional regulator [Acidobacteriota bacterium]
MKLELRLLRYAIAVAEDLHFTRASQRLHLATPSLSRQIQQLEYTLGYPLFERRTRSVELTPAGRAFVIEARRALMCVQRAVEAGAAANAGNTGVIRLGCTPLLGGAGLLPQIRGAFAKRSGSVLLFVQSAYTTAQLDQLLYGGLDVGLVVLPVVRDELVIEPMHRFRLILAVPERSALAERLIVEPEDLSEQPIVWFGKSINPFLYQHFVECCQRAGFTPNIVHEVSTVMEILDVVAGGIGIGFVKDSIPRRFRPEGIVFREINTPVLSLEVGIAYRRDTRSENLLTALEVLKQIVLPAQ